MSSAAPTVAAPRPWTARVASPLLAVLALAVALTAQLVWVLGHNVLDSDRFAQVTIETLRTPAGQEVIVDQVRRAAARAASERGARLPEPFGRALPEAVAGTVALHVFPALVRPTALAAHRRLLDDPARPLVIDLEALREDLGRRLARSDPDLVAYLPPPGELGTLTVTPAEEYPSLGRVASAVDTLRRLPLVGGLAAAALLAIALVLAGDRARLARRAGAALLVLAAVPALVRYALPPIGEALASGTDAERLTPDVAADLLAGYWPATVVTGAVGLALLAAGLATGRGRRA